MSIPSIYYEPQRGGLCRLHALNAYFGKTMYTDIDFNKFINEYDSYVKSIHVDYVAMSSKDYDTTLGQENLVSYILRKNKVITRYCAMYDKKRDVNLNALKGDFFFCFNADHIWGYKLVNNVWYKVDSLSGVSRFADKISKDMQTLISNLSYGFLIPVNIINEYTYELYKLKRIALDNKLNDRLSIINYIKKLNNEKSALGDMEIIIYKCVNILSTVDKSIREKPVYKRYNNIIKLYYDFMKQFTSKGGYLNLSLKLTYLPDILYELINTPIS